MSIIVIAASDHTDAKVGYYLAVPQFKPWPMKKLSKSMSTLWESDPNKALWNLITKAWSIIRDQVGKDNAPLREFYDIVCPEYKIPSPEVYLDLLGWTFVINEHGDPALLRDELQMPLDLGTSQRATSVADIIAFAKFKGYAAGKDIDPDEQDSTFMTDTLARRVDAEDDDQDDDQNDDQDRSEFLEELERRIAAIDNFASLLPAPAPMLSNHPPFDPRGVQPGNFNFNDPFYNVPDDFAAHIIAGAQYADPALMFGSASMTQPAQIMQSTPMMQPLMIGAAPAGRSIQMNEPTQMFGSAFMAADSLSEDFQEDPDSTMDEAESSAFRVGADSDATLPTFWHN